MSFSFLRSGDRERSRDLDRERERDLDLERRRAVGEGSFGAEDCAGAASAENHEERQHTQRTAGGCHLAHFLRTPMPELR